MCEPGRAATTMTSPLAPALALAPDSYGCHAAKHLCPTQLAASRQSSADIRQVFDLPSQSSQSQPPDAPMPCHRSREAVTLTLHGYLTNTTRTAAHCSTVVLVHRASLHSRFEPFRSRSHLPSWNGSSASQPMARPLSGWGRPDRGTRLSGRGAALDRRTHRRVARALAAPWPQGTACGTSTSPAKRPVLTPR